MKESKVKIAGLNQQRWKITDVNPAVYNPRKTLRPGDDEYEALKRSIKTFGYVDPIIVNSDGTVIGGHQRLNVLIDLGYTDVDVAVVNLSKNDEKALNIALNKISGEFDMGKLEQIFSELQLEGYDATVSGFEQNEIADILHGIVDEERQTEELYSSKVQIPHYEIMGETPEVHELFDDSKASQLIADIESDQEITEEEREFLKLAASRHVIFDYRNIAEYYAAASPAMQGLMEDSALVIIDFDSAIAQGYVKLKRGIDDMVSDHGGYDDEA